MTQAVTELEELFIAAPSANKWQVNKDPVSDRSNIDQLLHNLEHVSSANCTLFSTIDVYEAASVATEDSPLLDGLSYGANRAYFEFQLRYLFKNLRIRRLGGLFGTGLKKNVVFDALSDNFLQLAKYNPKSTYQYTSIKSALSISLSNDYRNVGILNVTGCPITLEDLLPDYAQYFSSDEEVVSYDVRTSFNGCEPYFITREQTQNELSQFRLSVRSNVA